MPVNAARQRGHSYRVRRYVFENRPICPTGKSLADYQNPLVQPLLQKYFASPRGANQGHNSARLTQERGGSRSSRTLRWDAVDADVTKTNVADADGEVVWS
jgi:hypothetical protein